MRKFTVLFILTLFVFSFARDTIFNSDSFGQFPKFSSLKSINVLPLSVETQEDIELSVAKVFETDPNVLTEDSGVESVEDLENLVLEVPTEAKVEEKVQEKVQEKVEEKVTNTEEILEESQVEELLNSSEPKSTETLEQETLVDEVAKIESKQADKPLVSDPKQCFEFCTQTGSDAGFCTKHCSFLQK